MTADVHDRLQAIFRDVFNETVVITDDMTADDVPEWDSVAHINLMFAIEHAFGVQFAPAQLAGFRNVGELKRYLEATTA